MSKVPRAQKVANFWYKAVRFHAKYQILFLCLYISSKKCDILRLPFNYIILRMTGTHLLNTTVSGLELRKWSGCILCCSLRVNRKQGCGRSRNYLPNCPFLLSTTTSSGWNRMSMGMWALNNNPKLQRMSDCRKDPHCCSWSCNTHFQKVWFCSKTSELQLELEGKFVQGVCLVQLLPWQLSQTCCCRNN